MKRGVAAFGLSGVLGSCCYLDRELCLPEPGEAEFPDTEREILFASDREPRGVYAVQPDGTGLRFVTSISGPSWTVVPRWSPDRRRVIYADGKPPAELMQIWVVNADGSGERALTPPEMMFATPSYSADGRRILLHGSAPTTGEPNRIWVMDADGTNLRRLTEGNHHDLHADWSPDGRRIVFDRYEDLGPTQDVWVMDADGANPQNLTPGQPGYDGAARWSPDGTQIAFHSTRGGMHEIYVMDPDGENVRQVRRADPNSQEGGPTWSADGTELAFNREDFVLGGQDIVRVPAMGEGEPVFLTRDPFIDINPTWGR